MSRKEVKRLAVIQRLLHQQITSREAAMLLGLSVRQVYRLKARDGDLQVRQPNGQGGRR